MKYWCRFYATAALLSALGITLIAPIGRVSYPVEHSTLPQEETKVESPSRLASAPPSQRVTWIPTECEAHSKYSQSTYNTTLIFREATAHGPWSEYHERMQCFYFASGKWVPPLDEGAFHTDVRTVVEGGHIAGQRWTCSIDQLRRQNLHVVLTREEEPHMTAPPNATYGGWPRKIRSAVFRHAECELVGLRDPYALLVALASLSTVGYGWPAIEIVGDSMHRGLFSTIIALLRGIGDGSFFDRQSHSSMRYLVTNEGDLLTLDMRFVPPKPPLLEVVFNAAPFRQMRTLKNHLVLHKAKNPAILVTGGLDHGHFTCAQQHARVPLRQQFVAALSMHIAWAQRSAVRRWLDGPQRNQSLPFPPNDWESLVVLKSTLETPLGPNTIQGHFSFLNHLYRGVVDDAMTRTLRASSPIVPRAYLEVAPSVLLLEDNRLYNIPREAPPAVMAAPRRPTKNTPPSSSSSPLPLFFNLSAVYDDEFSVTDGIHPTCVLYGQIPRPVALWRLMPTATCRGWRERANVQLLASMAVATARRRHTAHAAYSARMRREGSQQRL